MIAVGFLHRAAGRGGPGACACRFNLAPQLPFTAAVLLCPRIRFQECAPREARSAEGKGLGFRV